VACGGQHNVSDVIAAALWAMDFQFNLAAVKVSGINYHGGAGAMYLWQRCDDFLRFLLVMVLLTINLLIRMFLK